MAAYRKTAISKFWSSNTPQRVLQNFILKKDLLFVHIAAFKRRDWPISAFHVISVFIVTSFVNCGAAC